MSYTLQISMKNTFLNISDSPRPTFRRAHTTASLVGSESSYSLSPMCSPLALSTSSDERTKVLDSYVASVGQCPQTTVMVRGIPKNYDQEMLLAEVQEEGLPVNFLYLPPGKSKANRSYGFINFETEFAAEKFLRSFQGHQWRQTIVPKFANAGMATLPTGGGKISHGMATLQGYDQNIEFFSKQEVAAGVSKRSPWVKHY